MVDLTIMKSQQENKDHAMDIMPEILSRFTPQSLINEQIDQKVLYRILEAGRLAPSAKNRQPWRFILIRDPNVKKKLREACYNEQIIADAPAIIAVCTTNTEYRMPNSHLSWPVDLSFASAFMCLQAQHEGFNSVIYTTFHEDEVRQILTVPHSMRVLLLLLIGKTSENKSAVHDRLKRDRIISEEHW